MTKYNCLSSEDSLRQSVVKSLCTDDNNNNNDILRSDMFNIIKIDARETIYITICVAINTTHTLWYIFLPCPFIQYLLISVEKAKLKMNKFNIKKIK